MSYLTMNEQKARRNRQLKRCALLSLGILGLALLLVMRRLLPCQGQCQTQQPFHVTSENNAFQGAECDSPGVKRTQMSD